MSLPYSSSRYLRCRNDTIESLRSLNCEYLGEIDGSISRYRRHYYKSIIPGFCSHSHTTNVRNQRIRAQSCLSQLPDYALLFLKHIAYNVTCSNDEKNLICCLKADGLEKNFHTLYIEITSKADGLEKNFLTLHIEIILKACSPNNLKQTLLHFPKPPS